MSSIDITLASNLNRSRESSSFTTKTPMDMSTSKIFWLIKRYFVIAYLQFQGKLSSSRKALVNGIFTQLDQDKDGFVSVEDIKAAFNPAKHPDVLAGSAKVQQVKIEFLDSLESYANYLVY
jgi:hypothetical protein